MCRHGKQYGCAECKIERRERPGSAPSRAEKAFDNLFTPAKPPEPPKQKTDAERILETLTRSKQECICVDHAPGENAGCDNELCFICNPDEAKRQEEKARMAANRPFVREHEASVKNKPKSEPAEPAVDYRVVLGLDRDDLIKLLDTQIGTEMQPDEKHKVLKPKDAVEARITDLKTGIAQVEKRIAEVKPQIAESEYNLNGLNMGVMKIRRRNNPEDIIHDKNRRDQLKYEEQKILDEYQEKKRNLEKQLRNYRHELIQVQVRAANWGSNPDDYELKRVMVEVPVKLQDTFVLDADEDNFHGNLPTGHDYGVGAYVQLVYLYGPLDRFFKGWKDFENRIVFRAIAWDLIKPSEEILKAHPKLDKSKERQDAPAADEIEADQTEDKLIIKTKGGAIGGGIYSHRRETFEKYDQNWRRGFEDRHWKQTPGTEREFETTYSRGISEDNYSEESGA